MTEYADRIPAPRPVPTTRHRLTDARTCDALCRDIEVERDDLRIQTGRLEADNRAMMRDRDQALAERDAARRLNNQLAETIGRKQDTINAWAAELGAAGDVLAVVRDAAERIDRALATYDTQQQQHVSVLGWCITCGSKCPNGRCPNDASPRLGSLPPRAQDEPAELPAWVLDLVRGLDRYELEHPTLYRQNGDGTYGRWPCPEPLLALVPAEIRRLAEREG